MLHAVISDQDVHETYWPMVGAVRQMINACEGSGEIHPGGDAGDVLMLLSVLWQIPPSTGGQAQAARLLTLVFRGLGAED